MCFRQVPSRWLCLVSFCHLTPNKGPDHRPLTSHAESRTSFPKSLVDRLINRRIVRSHFLVVGRRCWFRVRKSTFHAPWTNTRIELKYGTRQEKAHSSFAKGISSSNGTGLAPISQHLLSDCILNFAVASCDAPELFLIFFVLDLQLHNQPQPCLLVPPPLVTPLDNNAP